MGETVVKIFLVVITIGGIIASFCFENLSGRKKKDSKVDFEGENPEK